MQTGLALAQPIEDATTTGVPAGTPLTPVSGFKTSSDGQVIDSLLVNGSIIIAHNNVTIKRGKVVSDTWSIIHDIKGHSGLTVMDCELDGNYSNSAETGQGIWRAAGATFLRNHIYGCENAFTRVGGLSLIQELCTRLRCPVGLFTALRWHPDGRRQS
jgi:hypothetical protein